jgi:hypothetical protein
MEIRNIKHKGLKNFIEKGQTKGVPPQYIDKIGDILGFLLDIEVNWGTGWRVCAFGNTELAHNIRT